MHQMLPSASRMGAVVAVKVSPLVLAAMRVFPVAGQVVISKGSEGAVVAVEFCCFLPIRAVGGLPVEEQVSFPEGP